MKYLCLVYREAGTLEALPNHEREALERAVHDYADERRHDRRDIVSSTFEPGIFVTTVSFRNGKPTVVEGGRSRSTIQLGGFHLIEARDLNDAIRVASKLPLALLGFVEVRPLHDCFAAHVNR